MTRKNLKYTYMDNLYYKYACPPLLQDSRFLTTHLNPRWLDQSIKKQYNINNSDNYRQFMQNNGEEFILNEFKTLILANSCLSK